MLSEEVQLRVCPSELLTYFLEARVLKNGRSANTLSVRAAMADASSAVPVRSTTRGGNGRESGFPGLNCISTMSKTQWNPSRVSRASRPGSVDRQLAPRTAPAVGLEVSRTPVSSLVNSSVAAVM